MPGIPFVVVAAAAATSGCPDLGVSENRGPYTLNSRILIIRTPK